MDDTTKTPPQFTDLAGRKWHLSIGVTTAKRVKTLANVDLLEADAELCHRLSIDPETLVNVLCAVLRPQLDAAGVSDEDFGESLGGDALDHAAAALGEAIIAFFPRHRRAILAETQRMVQNRTNQLLTSASSRLYRLDGTLDDMVSQALSKMDQEIDGLLAQHATPGEPSTN